MDAFKEIVDAYKHRFGPLSVRMLFRPPHEIEKIAQHIMIALKRDRALTEIEIDSLNTEDEDSTISQAVIGDRLPQAIFETMDQTGPIRLSAHQIFANRTAFIFAVPGAFTPSCHYLHIPGFVADYHKFRKLGADIVVCVSVNDVFVLHEWAIATDPRGQLLFLSDGNLEFTRA
ncbi:MAG: redoxin family protein, partial [Chitinophagales bacterium]|nr:redoxin family protein [Hyphomicrobiales bacterium]